MTYHKVMTLLATVLALSIAPAVHAQSQAPAWKNIDSGLCRDYPGSQACTNVRWTRYLLTDLELLTESGVSVTYHPGTYLQLDLFQTVVDPNGSTWVGACFYSFSSSPSPCQQAVSKRYLPIELMRALDQPADQPALRGDDPV